MARHNYNELTLEQAEDLLMEHVHLRLERDELTQDLFEEYSDRYPRLTVAKIQNLVQSHPEVRRLNLEAAEAHAVTRCVTWRFGIGGKYSLEQSAD